MMETYCLACDKPGHLTTECHSTHALNTPADRELVRLLQEIHNTTHQDVTIGRLKKRINKLLKQRDHWKQEHDALRKVYDSFPLFEIARIRNLDLRKAQQERKDLEARCKEQALLIEKLTKEQP